MKTIDAPDEKTADLASRNRDAEAESSLAHLQLQYQPLADLQSGLLAGLEVSYSLQDHSSNQIVSECGTVSVIDDQMLDVVFQHMQEWKASGFPNVRVAASVSLRQFRDPKFADRIEAALTGAGLDPGMLWLQFTETHLIENPPSGEGTLRQLKMLGTHLVLDHFGTGFASLAHLRRFPFDAVKIDRTLIQAVEVDPDTATMSRAIISMAQSLGLQVQATGVQNEAQCDFLRRNMCDEFQGTFYHQPLPADQIAPLLMEAPCLPEHLRQFHKPARTLLLVDDEVNILASLKRLLRRDGYIILQANSGQEGLELLAKNEVDVIVSDQRMPGMTGVEFLREAKNLYPHTVRIVLSGYTELQSVTDAINEGAIYKFLTKPWEDQRIRGHIEDAFKHKEMADENRRLGLEVLQANKKMAATNRKLEEVLTQQRQQIARDEVSLDIVREILQQMPQAAIGLDEDDVVVFINPAAQNLFQPPGSILGEDANLFLPKLIEAANSAAPGHACIGELNGMSFQILSHAMGKGSHSRGRLLTLTACEASPK